MESPKVSQAEQVRKMFKEFSARPNIQIINQLVTLIKDSEDPEVTTAILEAFDFKTRNLGVFGLALHCLGLVRDARAADYLMKQFDALSTATPHQDPKTQAICADHLQRTALSIITLIKTGRDSNPKALPYIHSISEPDSFSREIKTLALNAIRIFSDSHSLTHGFRQKDSRKPP
jgi:hypothetical protein